MLQFKTFINEKASIGEVDINRFSKAIAEEYEYASEPTPRIIASYTALRNHINMMYEHVVDKYKLTVIPVPNDPYKSDVDMVNDVKQNNRLKVYTGYSDNHPLFSREENIRFRVVHDFFSHFIPNKAHLKTGSIKGSSLLGHDFTFMGELQAYRAHTAYSSGAPIIDAALFSEIVAQVCYFQHFKKFPDPQKMVDYTEILDINNISMSSFK